jgi:hypothetical protein
MKQVEYEEVKHQEINLRERVSTKELKVNVDTVNLTIKNNHPQTKGVPNPIKLLVSK